MKNKNLRNLLIGAVVVVAGVAVTMYSCEKETITPADQLTGETVELKSVLPVEQDICSEIVKKKLVRASGREYVGEAYIYNDAENMYVLLHADKGTFFRDAYLDAQESMEDFPMNSHGNMAFTDFDYKIDGTPMSNVRRFVLPLNKIKGKKYFSAVVQVRSTRYNDVKERAWIQGRLVGGDEKGHAFIYDVEFCKTTPIDLPAENVKPAKPVVEPVNDKGQE
jgi:hypothetical protein